MSDENGNPIVAEPVINPDNLEVQKTHPRAKDCFIISLVPMVLFDCGMALTLLDDAFPAYHLDIVGYDKLIICLFLISLLMQPLGLILGIFSLVQMRKYPTYTGNFYAISGIMISIFSFIVGGGFLG
jgi:hypothetical protein